MTAPRCPDCGGRAVTVGSVRRCCPSPATAAALGIRTDAEWRARQARLAALDRADAGPDRLAAISQWPPSRPRRLARRWRRRLARWWPW